MASTDEPVDYYSLKVWPAGEPRESPTPTGYAVWCDCKGKRQLVFMTEHFYQFCMGDPNSTWRCPVCLGKDCTWSDDNYEKYFPDSGDEL